jgi:two-component system NtrC family sensor kinase
MDPTDSSTPHTVRWQLDAEKVAVRIRWFGVAVGFVLVNLVDLGGGEANPPVLNAILALGALYALIDGLWRLRGQVFLERRPLVISVMETVFIGLLCFYDRGVDSPFLFYYVLSLVVCAIRYRPAVTYATFAMHTASYTALAVVTGALSLPLESRDLAAAVLTIVVGGWVTWASVALATLLKKAERRLEQLNEALLKEQAKLEERIEQRTKQLQEAQAHVLHQEKMAAFGLLAAGIAHEVGNPLASISALVQMLRLRNEDAYSQEKLALVDDQLRRIQGILRELVDFSRPASRHRSRVHLHEAIDAALNIAKYYKRTKGKRIETDYAPDVPAIRTMRDALVQVLLNLILNAMDAAPKGGTIRLETSADARCVRVRIVDNGPGIDPEHRSSLFRPYFTTKENGTGLGLFVSRALVEEMGGRLVPECSEPGYTVFSVVLPSDGTSRVQRLPLSRREQAGVPA